MINKLLYDILEKVIEHVPTGHELLEWNVNEKTVERLIDILTDFGRHETLAGVRAVLANNVVVHDIANNLDCLRLRYLTIADVLQLPQRKDVPKEVVANIPDLIGNADCTINVFDRLAIDRRLLDVLCELETQLRIAVAQDVAERLATDLKYFL